MLQGILNGWHKSLARTNSSRAWSWLVSCVLVVRLKYFSILNGLCLHAVGNRCIRRDSLLGAQFWRERMITSRRGKGLVSHEVQKIIITRFTCQNAVVRTLLTSLEYARISYAFLLEIMWRYTWPSGSSFDVNVWDIFGIEPERWYSVQLVNRCRSKVRYAMMFSFWFERYTVPIWEVITPCFDILGEILHIEHVRIKRTYGRPFFTFYHYSQDWSVSIYTSTESSSQTGRSCHPAPKTTIFEVKICGYKNAQWGKLAPGCFSLFRLTQNNDPFLHHIPIQFVWCHLSTENPMNLPIIILVLILRGTLCQFLMI